jgi:hypothetical protein
MSFRFDSRTDDVPAAISSLVDVGRHAREWMERCIEGDLLSWHDTNPHLPLPDPISLSAAGKSEVVQVWLRGQAHSQLGKVRTCTRDEELRAFLGALQFVPPVVEIEPS